MENYHIQDLLGATGGEFLLGDPHGVVKNISTDTRSLTRGEFYLALTGKNFDGHNFLQSAIEKRAAGLIISRKDIDLGNPFPAFPAIVRVPDTLKALGDIAGHYRRKWPIPVVGITGSNGKTTTKEFLRSILSKKGETLSTTGNLNNRIGMPLTLLKLTSAHRYAVIEMGTSLHGEISCLAGIASPNIGVITNIGMAHLETFKDKDGVLAEKIALYENLPADGIAVVNNDDPLLRTLPARLGRKAVTFGIESRADVRASNITSWPGKPSFEIAVFNDRASVTLPIHGTYNVYNALAAAAAAAALGIDIATIREGIATCVPPAMRMEISTLSSGVSIINDAYNANPSSMREAVAGFVQSFQDREKIVVLGDMLELGTGAEAEHRALGEFLAAQPLSSIFLYGPLMEQASRVLGSTGARHCVKKEELAFELKRQMNPGAVVLFKGSRGMHLEEIISAVSEEI